MYRTIDEWMRHRVLLAVVRLLVAVLAGEERIALVTYRVKQLLLKRPGVPPPRIWTSQNPIQPRKGW